ncbi:uncharacterized protein [Lepidochelys kempii]|uniref:uncharacterized protein n=1 Tax=Lepidochelys kempii TaxID=8472 RepID=UPI003C6F7B1D
MKESAQEHEPPGGQRGGDEHHGWTKTERTISGEGRTLSPAWQKKPGPSEPGSSVCRLPPQRFHRAGAVPGAGIVPLPRQGGGCFPARGEQPPKAPQQLGAGSGRLRRGRSHSPAAQGQSWGSIALRVAAVAAQPGGGEETRLGAELPDASHLSRRRRGSERKTPAPPPCTRAPKQRAEPGAAGGSYRRPEPRCVTAQGPGRPAQRRAQSPPESIAWGEPRTQQGAVCKRPSPVPPPPTHTLTALPGAVPAQTRARSANARVPSAIHSPGRRVQPALPERIAGRCPLPGPGAERKSRRSAGHGAFPAQTPGRWLVFLR